MLPYMYRCRSRSGSNQPEAMSVDMTTAPGKSKPTRKRKQVANKQKGRSLLVTFDSPAMATRSTKTDFASPAMSTRSKRRLSLWLFHGLSCIRYVCMPFMFVNLIYSNMCELGRMLCVRTYVIFELVMWTYCGISGLIVFVSIHLFMHCWTCSFSAIVKQWNFQNCMSVTVHFF